LWAGSWAQAQEESKGENFSAKPAPALFASDCTGSDCHKGPQGLAKGKSVGGLAGFLREHYTNSRESAAALAAYLMKVPAGAEPREARPARAPATREAAPSRPASEQARPSREHPSARSSRASAKPEEEGGAAAQPPHRGAEPPAASPAAPARNARTQRGRHQPAATQPPAAAPEPAPVPPPEPPAAPKAPKQFDIFD
jgi:hypothetical protein